MALLLAVLLSAVAAGLILRSRATNGAPATGPDEVGESVDQANPPKLPTVERPSGARSAPRLLPTVVQSDVTTDLATSQARADAGASRRKRASPAALKVWRQFRFVRQADEVLFESMKIPETARAAIRKINEDYRPPKGHMLGSVSEGASAYLDLQDRTRRNAIDNVLGSDTAKDFFAAEAAERDARENALQEFLSRVPPAAEEPDQQAVDAGPALP